MLFYKFLSQEERRSFGGSDFVEFSYCKLSKDTNPRDILLTNISHWNNSSLYICGDDCDRFYENYGEIITDGIYANLEKGCLDWFGINYFNSAELLSIIDKIKLLKPYDYKTLLDWLESGKDYNGFYVLGV